MQSKKASMIEVCINTLAGYLIALLTQILIFPIFDIHISTGSSMIIAVIFTVISIVRSYVMRRIFNYLHSEGILI